jgi:glyoxylase-like metal-dependent hydrolase (beta-lactamase superfamily II)
MVTLAAPGDAIAFPYAQAPEPGTLVAVAPGIFWLRLALPFLLNHVNVYLVEDDGGWAVLDTGLGDDATRQVWESVFAGPLRGQRITRVVCSHYHPDHMGLVGWLTRRFDCPLHVARTEFLMTKTLENRNFAANTDFYTERGLPVDASGVVSSDGHGYLSMMTGLPTQYYRLRAGGGLRIGGRDFTVLTGGGHAPEQVMLHCAADALFFSFDQVLTRISPNISVYAMEPEANPLGDYLASLEEIGETVPGGTLVLPGHHLPFYGLHTRLAELQAHHATRCALIEEACKAEPRSAAELVPVLFKRQMDAHQTGFAFGETLAHVNYMRAQGTLIEARGEDGILRTRTA